MPEWTSVESEIEALYRETFAAGLTGPSDAMLAVFARRAVAHGRARELRWCAMAAIRAPVSRDLAESWLTLSFALERGEVEP